MASKNLNFWFDFSCPYAYLASTRVEALAERTGATLEAKPVLLGGIFQAVGTNQRLFATLAPAKMEHNAKDLQRHADLWETPLRFPENHPLRTVTALRALLVAGKPYMPLAHKFYKAYWDDNLDIGDPEIVGRILEEHGLDADAILKKTQDQDIKDELRHRTDEAIEAGLFGVPGFQVGDEVYWGQDRMHFVESALGGNPDTIQSIAEYPEQEIHPVDFYFDYSSPFSYIAAMRAPRLLGPHLRWKPMLLGGVFNSIGTANVPLFEASAAKQRYLQKDCIRQASEARAVFHWPAHFPMNTVLPLRMTLIALREDKIRAQNFILATYQAYWASNKNISDPAVMAEVADSAGFDGQSLLQGTQDQSIKDALRHSTDDAVATGVFGAPTFVVRSGNGDPSIYWGNDRLALVIRAAMGDQKVL